MGEIEITKRFELPRPKGRWIRNSSKIYVRNWNCMAFDYLNFKYLGNNFSSHFLHIYH